MRVSLWGKFRFGENKIDKNSGMPEDFDYMDKWSMLMKELCACNYVNLYIIQLNVLNCPLPVTVCWTINNFK